MQIAPSVHLTTASRPEISRWEFVLRYAAATAATLVSIAGAQLVVANSFILLLVGLTLAGVPVSLFLRRTEMRVGSLRISRPLWNSLTVLGAFGASTYYVFWSLRDFLPVLSGQSPQLFLLRFGASELVRLLMQVFLLFAAFRSFALISDKDATLAIVPSFSVLLLLIPIHKGLEVVLYFLIWSLVAALLFALDHRQNVRASASGFVPAPLPGQEVVLAARSLGAVIGISFLASAGFSYFLTSRDASERSAAEDAINALVARLSGTALSLPENAINGGPERQIDFSSGPALASNLPLWQVSAWTLGGKPVHASYWRLFALNAYNGNSWSQGNEATILIEQTAPRPERWPSRLLSKPMAAGASYYGFGVRPRNAKPRPVYDIERAVPDAALQFGKRGALVRQNVTALVPNLGFLPLLPAARALRLPSSDQKQIRFRRDGGIDVGVVTAHQTVLFLSDVPSLPEYGLARGAIPTTQLSAAQIEKSGVRLAPFLRRATLQLPAKLPRRVAQTARAMLRASAPKESNYRRAQRLALALQNGAVYTLRPPTVPEGRDATDFFLFEGARRGYCTYFAGALAVLCRTQNIPARVVSGFYNDKFNPDGSAQLIEGNAHAWTEVWVEGWGWAVVDATPPDDRGENSPSWWANWSDWTVAGFNHLLLRAREHPALVVGVGGLLILAIIAGWCARFGVLQVRSGRGAVEADAERRLIVEIYNATARRIARRFRPRFTWETPDEWLQPFASTLPRSDAEALRRLISLYLAARYAERPLPSGSAHLARRTAQQINWKRAGR